MAPLAVHEDAAPCSKTKSLYCKSFSSLLAEGDEKVAKFMCCSCVKSPGRGRDGSWNLIFADLLALGTGMVDGIEVAKDPDGTIWFFCLLFATGDEEVHSNE
jgi:hypothetical protein